MNPKPQALTRTHVGRCVGGHVQHSPCGGLFFAFLGFCLTPHSKVSNQNPLPDADACLQVCGHVQHSPAVDRCNASVAAHRHTPLSPPASLALPLPLQGNWVQGTGYMVQGTGCRVQGSGYRVREQGTTSPPPPPSLLFALPLPCGICRGTSLVRHRPLP